MLNIFYFWAAVAVVIAIIGGVFSVYHFWQRYFGGSSHFATESLWGLACQTAIMVAYMCVATIANINTDTRDSFTMFLFAVGPLRKIAISCWPWIVLRAIPAHNTTFANQVYKNFFVDDKHQVRDVPAVWLVNLAVDVAALVVGSLFWAFPGLSSNRVNFWLHGLSALGDAFTGSPIGFFWWILLLVAFLVLLILTVYWAGKNQSLIASGKSVDHPHLPVILAIVTGVLFIVRKVYGWIFLAYGGRLILSDVLFWAVVALIVLLIVLAVRGIRALMAGRGTP